MIKTNNKLPKIYDELPTGLSHCTGLDRWCQIRDAGEIGPSGGDLESDWQDILERRSPLSP